MTARQWTRFTWSQVLLSQKVFWQDIAFAIVGALMPTGMGIASLIVYRQLAAEPGALPIAVYLLPGGMAATCLWIIYATVNSAARRRETRTYKRLRAAPLPESSILSGEAISAALPALVQAGIVMVVGVYLVGAPLPRHGILLIVALLLAVAAFALLSFGLSGLLPSGEIATWLVTPLVIGLWYLSGAITPLASLPFGLAKVAPFLPSTAAVDALRIAYFGRDLANGPALAGAPVLDLTHLLLAIGPSLLILIAWGLIGAGLWKRFFRWDPRRSK